MLLWLAPGIPLLKTSLPSHINEPLLLQPYCWEHRLQRSSGAFSVPSMKQLQCTHKSFFSPFSIEYQPISYKIRWFYFWYSMCSSSLRRGLPRLTIFMSFLPKLDLSGGILTTAWQTNRKRPPTELRSVPYLLP